MGHPMLEATSMPRNRRSWNQGVKEEKKEAERTQRRINGVDELTARANDWRLAHIARAFGMVLGLVTVSVTPTFGAAPGRATARLDSRALNPR